MPLQPSAHPSPDPAPVTIQGRPSHLPFGIRLGLALVLGAAAAGAAWEIWNVFGRTALASPGDVVTTIEVGGAFGAAEELLVGLGLFFVYLGLAKLLPGAAPWGRRGAAVVLSGTLAVVLGEIVATLLFAATYRTFQPAPPFAYYGAEILVTVGAGAVSVGTVLALFGFARGALAQVGFPPVTREP